MILVAFSMVALIGMMGVVADMGTVYFQQSELKKEATTAAFSGAQELANYDPTQLAQDEQRVREVVNRVLSTYQDGSTLTNLQITMNHDVSVSLEKSVPFSFAKIFGFNQAAVQESSDAGLVPITSVRGVVPLGIDQSLPVSYGDVVSLKVGPGSSTQGNFGILALEGTGASVYLDTLEYGTQNPVTVGQTYDIKTGNVEGNTQIGVQYRIDNSPYPYGETFHPDDPRVMTVVVYTPVDSKSIKVTGFAYFYLLSPGSDTSVVRGMFIKRVGAGSYVTGGLDRGAYTVKLLK